MTVDFAMQSDIVSVIFHNFAIRTENNTKNSNMRKIFYCLTIAATVVLLRFNASASAPAGYYKSLNGLSGQALKDAVHNLIAPHTVVTYNSLWYYFPSTDHMPDNDSRVWDMYSDNAYYYNGSGSAVKGMNREHSFPKSWWGGAVVDAYTDLNHLYPSDGPANLAKSNHPLGEVSSATFDNGVSKVGTPVSGEGGGSGTVFEPDDRYKGDFARTYFYMATCYQDYTWKYTYMVNNSTWKTLNDWSIAMLMKWSRNDPVSDKETSRNDAVYKIQNNRNPFIDLPQLAEYIWGNKAGQVFNVNDTTGGGGGGTTSKPELITPTQGTSLDFGEVALGKSIDYTVYIKGKNLTNDLSVQLYRYNYEMFSTNVTKIPRDAANSSEGYPLTVTYAPTALGNHKAKLLLSDGGLTGSIGVELAATCLPVPSLSAVKALPATDITDSSYVANWEASPDTIDSYLLTRTVYDGNGNLTSSETYTMTPDQTSYPFNDRKAGEKHTYYVQTLRLGYTSAASNVITLDVNGVTGVNADKPLALLHIDGGVVVKCSEPLGQARIYNTAGQLVRTIANLCNDAAIILPEGVYIMTTATSRQASKIVIR